MSISRHFLITLFIFEMRMKQIEKKFKEKFGFLQAFCSTDISLDWSKKRKWIQFWISALWWSLNSLILCLFFFASNPRNYHKNAEKTHVWFKPKWLSIIHFEQSSLTLISRRSWQRHPRERSILINDKKCSW